MNLTLHCVRTVWLQTILAELNYANYPDSKEIFPSTVADIMAKSDIELESFKYIMKALIKDEVKPILSDIV